MTLRELSDDYDILLPRDEGFETLGGFVLSRLGIIPQGEESFTCENRRFTVMEMEGRRVTKVKIDLDSSPLGATLETLPAGESAAETASPPDAPPRSRTRA